MITLTDYQYKLFCSYTLMKALNAWFMAETYRKMLVEDLKNG